MNLFKIFLDIFSGHGLVQFLIAILIIAIIVYALKLLFEWLFPPANVPKPIRILFWLIIAIIVILYLLNRFAGGINI